MGEAAIDDLFTALDAVTQEVGRDQVGTWDQEWARFADVAIVPEHPEPQPAGFYPEDRYVVTHHTRELAWLFSRLASSFSRVDGYGMWKEELFGRLGNAASWYLAANPEATASELCLAVICEAYRIADEMAWSESGMNAPLVVVDNQVRDDARDPLDGSRPTTAKAVRGQLASRGAL
jgi:hypothetical protein